MRSALPSTVYEPGGVQRSLQVTQGIEAQIRRYGLHDWQEVGNAEPRRDERRGQRPAFRHPALFQPERDGFFPLATLQHAQDRDFGVSRGVDGALQGVEGF